MLPCRPCLAAAPLPPADRLSAVVQLLSELCELGLPFAAVLTVIRDELVRAIYSDHFLSRDGSLTFDQVTAAAPTSMRRLGAG